MTEGIWNLYNTVRSATRAYSYDEIGWLQAVCRYCESLDGLSGGLDIFESLDEKLSSWSSIAGIEVNSD